MLVGCVTESSLRPTVLQNLGAVENAPYLLTAPARFMTLVGSCGSERRASGSLAASCAPKIEQGGGRVAAFSSCGAKIGGDGEEVAAFASCGDI